MSDVKNENDEASIPNTESEPKKLLLGKRVLRDFVVRSGVRTGKCNTTVSGSDISGSTCWCSRSR